MDEFAAELSRLRAEIAAHLAWEAELGGSGLPSISAAEISRSVAGTAAVSPEAASEITRPTAVAMAGGGPASVFALSERSPIDKHRRLGLIEDEARVCTRCELHKGRTKSVFARGNPDSPLVFVGEGPGQEEDRQGRPFVGPAGQLLDKMIAAMGFGADEVYICNVVKCRPPNNRTPLTAEAQACEAYLTGQIEAVAPRVIVALGRCAAENMGLVPAGGGWRGRWGSYRGVAVMPTYHPAFLLRSPEFKRPVWEDLQQVTAKLRQG